VTFGEPMVLLLATDDLPLPIAQRFDYALAGAESNLATGLARLEHRVAYFGRVAPTASANESGRRCAPKGSTSAA
jgi:2-dehydro-3-deoxygluconokinase